MTPRKHKNVENVAPKVCDFLKIDGYDIGYFDDEIRHLDTVTHSDLIEFTGEFGLIGSILLFLSVLFISIKNHIFNFKNIILFYLLFFILTFDFSFHIPLIQLLFILLLSVNYKRNNDVKYKFNR